MRGSLSLLMMVAAIPFVAPEAGAQVRQLELTLFLPLANLVEVPEVDLQFTHKTGAAFGGRAALSLTGRLGVEGSFLYALSDGESDD